MEGLVVDARDGAPLFDFGLAAWPLGLRETHIHSTRTEAEGRFSFGSIEPDDGSSRGVLIEARDHAGIERRESAPRLRLERSDPSERLPLPARFAVSVGPTIPFELALPGGMTASDFDVDLLYGPPGGGARVQADSSAELRAPLSFGPHPGLHWVRFGEPTRLRERAWVEVRSRDKAWRGGAWLATLEGVVSPPLAITLERATRAHGRFEWPASVAEPYVQELRLARLVDGELSDPVLNGFAGDSGEFRFEFLRPGRYRLWTNDRNWRPFQCEFELVAGDNDVGVHRLEPRRVVGAIRGVIRTRSGRYDGACHVSLSDTPLIHDAPYDHSIDFEPSVEGDPLSERVARFEFEDVTEGDWFLFVHCHDGFEFPQSVARVQAPLEQFELLLDDASLRLRVEIVEAESGRPCAEARFEWECGDERDVEQGAKVDRERLPATPERLVWSACAPGRQARFGTGADFELLVLPDGSRELVGALALELGFVRRIRVRGGAGGRGIEGVEVLCDGVSVGFTDSTGDLIVRSATPPERITLRKSGWFQRSSRDLDARSGRYSDRADLHASMSPENP